MVLLKFQPLLNTRLQCVHKGEAYLTDFSVFAGLQMCNDPSCGHLDQPFCVKYLL